MLPVYKPLLPVLSQLSPYLKLIDDNRYYTNYGPLIQEFETRLAQHFNVNKERIITSANGTVALVQLLKTLNLLDKSLCVIPSWTFIATPAAVLAAGHVPYFVDVDHQTWAITPDHVLDVMRDHPVGAVIVVSPFGAPIDIVVWEEFKQQTGIPVIIDAAASFDAFAQIQTTLPYMVSFHATKSFGIGEGAVVVASSAKEAEQIKLWGKFGFAEYREAILPGFNAKLSEYSAAVGLAALDEWPRKRQQWQDMTQKFSTKVSQISGLKSFPNFNQGWISSYGIIEFSEEFKSDQVAAQLLRHGVQTVAWWGKGCHTHPAYTQYPHSELKNTAYLSEHTLGLPFWIGLSDADLGHIFNELKTILNHANYKGSHYA